MIHFISSNIHLFAITRFMTPILMSRSYPMKPNQISDSYFENHMGERCWLASFVIVSLLQFEVLVGHAYGQSACLVVGMVLVKLAHVATLKGIGRAAQMENASNKNTGPKMLINKNYQRSAASRSRPGLAQSSGFWSAIKAILAAELQVRSIVKSVLCAVTETLTPRLFPCPPIARA
jgi:hypothetical protein